MDDFILMASLHSPPHDCYFATFPAKEHMMSMEVSRRKFLEGVAVSGAAGAGFLKDLSRPAEADPAAGDSPRKAAIQYAPSTRMWALRSGNVEYRLGQREGVVYLKYFGPAGQPDWDVAGRHTGPPRNAGLRYDLVGVAEGESLRPENLNLVSHVIQHPKEDVDELTLVFEHEKLSLEISVHYRTWGQTGVITRQITLRNKSNHPLHVKELPSLAWELPPGNYDLTYLWGGWAHERQVANEQLGPGRRSFIMTRGRSTNGYSPWFCLHHRELGVRYLGQLAYSGNWEMHFEEYPDGQSLVLENLSVSLGMHFDFGGPLQLAADQSFEFPLVAFTATSGDMDDGANQLHRFQRQYVVPRTPTNNPLLVQFNSWYPFPGEMNVEQMKRCVDVAGPLGAEVFVLDAGWFSSKNWSRELGDWTVNRAAYPNGMQELARYVRGKGMKFGIWVEIENLGVDSKTFREHPDWCLTYNDKPLLIDERCPLNFAKPVVRKWATSVIDRFVRDYGIEWLKIDYNIDVGELFDPPALLARPGEVLYRDRTSYYDWLDEIRSRYPDLVIENCSSGGLRFDLGIIGHTHTTWLSDEVRPKPSVQLAYGSTVEFIPEICNHWMVGDKKNGEVNLSNPEGWWDFMFRVPMTGQFGISSRVFDWNPALIDRAKLNIALYKKIRHAIMGADVYHLTPCPDHEDPNGWGTILYASPDRKRGVLLAYRLASSVSTRVFKLRGLAPGHTYQIATDGTDRETLSGQALLSDGLRVELKDPWRASIIEVSQIS
jgi:alpha-galactosidase